VPEPPKPYQLQISGKPWSLIFASTWLSPRLLGLNASHMLTDAQADEIRGGLVPSTIRTCGVGFFCRLGGMALERLTSPPRRALSPGCGQATLTYRPLPRPREGMRSFFTAMSQGLSCPEPFQLHHLVAHP
jgi:hypothetical protein